MKVWRIKFQGFAPYLIVGGATETEARETCARLTARTVASCVAVEFTPLVLTPVDDGPPTEKMPVQETDLPSSERWRIHEKGN